MNKEKLITPVEETNDERELVKLGRNPNHEFVRYLYSHAAKFGDIILSVTVVYGAANLDMALMIAM